MHLQCPAILLNRAGDVFTLPADGMIQLIPIGDAPPCADPADGTTPIVQVLDKDALTAMLNTAKTNGAEILCDFDHASHSPTGDSRAAFWVHPDTLELRADGMWGKPRWTSTGSQSVTGGDFRFISPVFDRASCADLGGGRIRPMRLLDFGLTNDARLKSLMAPISNSNVAGASSSPAAPITKPTYTISMDYKTAICQLLGLDPATATDEQITAAVAADGEERSEEILNKYPGVQNRAAVKAQLLVNRKGTIALLEAIGKAQVVVGADPTKAGQAPLHNRATAKPPGATPGVEDTAASAAEQVRANKIRNRAAEIETSQRIPYPAAFRAAQAEFPAL